MVIDMNVSRLATVEQIREFLKGAADVAFANPADEATRRPVRVFAASDGLFTITGCVFWRIVIKNRPRPEWMISVTFRWRVKRRIFSGEVLPTEKLSVRKIREVLQLTFVGQ